MGATERHGYDETRKQLVEEGTRSYLEAVTALIEYQREVQKKCRTVMEEHLEEYASALGVSLKTGEIQNQALPSFGVWEGSWWLLGVKIVRKNIPGIRWWETNCCLQYESGENGLFCWIGEWFHTTKMAADVFSRFQRLNRVVQQQGKEIWVQHGLKMDESTTFQDVLDTLFPQWIALWKKVGGIKGAFKRGVGKKDDSDDD